MKRTAPAIGLYSVVGTVFVGKVALGFAYPVVATDPDGAVGTAQRLAVREFGVGPESVLVEFVDGPGEIKEPGPPHPPTFPPGT